MKYSEYVKELRTWVWEDQEGKIVADKKKNYELAKSLGIPVPERYELPKEFVFKPSNGFGSQNVFFGSENYILEEMIIDENGKFPARVFYLYFFNNKLEFLHITNLTSESKKFNKNDYNISRGYYDKNWNSIDICIEKNYYQCEKPSSFDDMIKYGELFSKQFKSKVIRVDFFASNNGAIYNECCITPGILDRIKEEWDIKLGKLI